MEAQNLKDISQLNIDMVGFNFYKPSARYVQEILHQASPCIKNVGVFVNASIEDIIDKKEIYHLNYAQLHGDESPEFAAEVSKIIPVIKVFRIDENFDSKILMDFDFCDIFLFDTASKNYGGSGRKFNWNLLNGFDINSPFMLSGGIGPDDIDELLQFDHPKYIGIDVNSKFEISSGVKDVEMVKMFVSSVKKDISSRAPQSLKGRSTQNIIDKINNEDAISPLGVGGKEGKEGEDEKEKADISSRAPQSLKGRSTQNIIDKINNEDAISPLGVGGKEHIDSKDASRDPHSLKGRSTPEISTTAELSPLGVGGIKGEEDESTTRYPQSVKGRPTLKNSDQALITHLGVGGEDDKGKALLPSRDPHSLKGRPNEQNYDMFYEAPPLIFERAASLRRNMTKEEIIVWEYLKSKPLGYKFRRQHPVNIFIVDFYCHALKIVFEIDGPNHIYIKEGDKLREDYLQNVGIRTYRFTNYDINDNIDNVISKILHIITTSTRTSK